MLAPSPQLLWLWHVACSRAWTLIAFVKLLDDTPQPWAATQLLVGMPNSVINHHRFP